MSDTPPDDPPARRDEPGDEPRDEQPEVELTGPIGWLFGLINQFLMLGVKMAVALVQGILGAFLGGKRADDEDKDKDKDAP